MGFSGSLSFLFEKTSSEEPQITGTIFRARDNRNGNRLSDIGKGQE
jgi:hypothetical protein